MEGSQDGRVKRPLQEEMEDRGRAQGLRCFVVGSARQDDHIFMDAQKPRRCRRV